MSEYPRVREDDELGAIYIYLSSAEVATTRDYPGSVNIDFAVDGEVVGIEVLL